MTNECIHCKKIFSSKSNLNTHIKSAKNCISQRVTESNIQNFKCNVCCNEFTTKQRLISHENKCLSNQTIINLKSKLDEIVKDLHHKENLLIQKDEKLIQLEIIIDSYKSQIKELQDKLANLCEKAIEKPTHIHLKNNNDQSVNNMMYNNLQAVNLDPDHLYKVLDKAITLADIFGGQQALAKVIKREILTNENGEPLAVCSDRARQMIKYKNMDNQIIKDPKAYNLISQIQPIANKIALKRKTEFEAVHYSSNEEKKEKEDSLTEQESSEDEYESVFERYHKRNYFENDETEDEDEIIEQDVKNLKKTLTSPPNFKVSPEKQKQKEKIIQKSMQKVIKTIEKKDEWPPEKKEYYFNLLIEGIQQYQILHINSNVFSKVLSMILPQENLSAIKGDSQLDSNGLDGLDIKENKNELI